MSRNVFYEHVSYPIPSMPGVYLESLDIVTRRVEPTFAIIAWESVDQDDLYPAPNDCNRIRREEIGR